MSSAATNDNDNNNNNFLSTFTKNILDSHKSFLLTELIIISKSIAYDNKL